MLPFIPRGLPVYQSHGIVHSQTIVRNINSILRSWRIPVSSREAYFLYLAAWVHDLGYLHPETIHTRAVHPELSCRILADAEIFPLTPDEYPVLEEIIRFREYADGKSGTSGENNRTDLLGALFHLADSLDIGKDRCPPTVFTLIREALDEQASLHWLAHAHVSGYSFACPDVIIRLSEKGSVPVATRIKPHLEEDCRYTGEVFKTYGYLPPRIIYLEPDG